VAFLLVIKACKRDFPSGAEALRIQYRLNWYTATTLYRGVVNTKLWWYFVREERLAKLKYCRGLWSLALGATWLFAKMLEERVSTQGYLAATSNNVIKGVLYKEMKEKGGIPWFNKGDTKARAL
jgi:hypothetical protein